MRDRPPHRGLRPLLSKIYTERTAYTTTITQRMLWRKSYHISTKTVAFRLPPVPSVNMEPRWRSTSTVLLKNRGLWTVYKKKNDAWIFSQEDRTSRRKIKYLLCGQKENFILRGNEGNFQEEDIGQEWYETTPTLCSTQNYQHWIVHSRPQNHSA